MAGKAAAAPPLSPFDRGAPAPAARTYKHEYRKLPPSNVVEVLSGPDGPRLWDNIREGLRVYDRKNSRPPKRPEEGKTHE